MIAVDHVELTGADRSPAGARPGGTVATRADPVSPRRPGRDDAGQTRHPLLTAVLVVILAALGGPLTELVSGGSGGTPGAAAAAAGGDRPAPAAPALHVVQPGETYWSIAVGLPRSGGDVRALVDALAEANGGRQLRAGDRLALPVTDPGAPPPGR